MKVGTHVFAGALTPNAKDGAFPGVTREIDRRFSKLSRSGPVNRVFSPGFY